MNRIYLNTTRPSCGAPSRRAGIRANLAVIDQLYAADFIFHQESGEAARGLDFFKTWIATITALSPTFATRSRRCSRKGTRLPPATRAGDPSWRLPGFASDGQVLRFDRPSHSPVVAGKKTEGWGICDTLGLMIQLGIIPPVRLGGGAPPLDTAANIAATRRLFEALSSRDPEVLRRPSTS